MNTGNSLPTVLYRVVWQHGAYESTPRLFTDPGEARRHASALSTGPGVSVVVHKTGLDWTIDRSTMMGSL